MKIGLCLGGGGSRGYAHIGAIRALTEAGIKIDLVNGTSMGAIMGGMYALYMDVDEMTDRVRRQPSRSMLIISIYSNTPKRDRPSCRTG